MKQKLYAMLAAALLMASAAVHAEAYQPFKIDSIEKSHSGGKVEISIEPMVRAVEQLRRHAAEYPPHFDSEADKAAAKKDAFVLFGLFGELLKMQGASLKPEERRFIILNMARTAAVSHNLDTPNAGEAAFMYYRALLKEKQTPQLAEEYGVFAINAGQVAEGKKWLQKALDSGNYHALNGLSMAAMFENNIPAAKDYLRKYRQYYPKDPEAEIFEKALNDPETTIKNCDAKSAKSDPECKTMMKKP